MNKDIFKFFIFIFTSIEHRLIRLLKPIMDYIYENEKLSAIYDFKRSIDGDYYIVEESDKDSVKKLIKKRSKKKFLILSRKSLKNINFDSEREFLFASGYAYTIGAKLKEDPFLSHKYSILFLIIVLLNLWVQFFNGYVPYFSDLLRHLKSWKYNYDYRTMFSHSWNFSFDPYPLFDFFIYSYVDKIFGIFALPIFASLSFISFFIAFQFMTRGWDDRVRAFFMYLVVNILNIRTVLAQPSNFLGFLFPIFASLSGIWAFIAGIFVGFSYYFFFIYLLPLIHKKPYLIAFILSIIFWLLYSHGLFFSELAHFIYLGLFNRMFMIVENLSFFYLFKSPTFFIFALLFVNSLKLPKNRWIILYAVFFALLMQIRFLDTLLLLLMAFIDHRKWVKLFDLAWAKFFLVVAITLINFYPIVNIRGLDFGWSNGDVLTMGPTKSFWVLYFGHNVTAAPAMELGFTDAKVQSIISDIINNRTVDCKSLRAYNFTYLVENSISEKKECLEFYHRWIDGYVIWKVK